MTAMLQRIRERAAFDERFDIQQYPHKWVRKDRVDPLIDALIQAVEVSYKALHCNKEICEISGGCYNCEARASMQSILEKAVRP